MQNLAEQSVVECLVTTCAADQIETNHCMVASKSASRGSGELIATSMAAMAEVLRL